METTEAHNEVDALFEHHRFEVDKGQQPLRIDKFLVNRMEQASRNKIQAAAEAGNILVNDKPVKPNYKVKPHDLITIMMAYPRREIELIPQDLPLDIIYEDEQVIVVNKEPGMVVHPGYGNYTGTLVNALAWHMKDAPLFKEGGIRPGLVHRIDKFTSGLLVIAKTEPALQHLARQFFERTVKRRYVALVWGNMEEDQGTITGNIGRSLKNRKKMNVFPDGDYGKHAVTHYKVLERFSYVNLVECRLETGRTHQIRVHFEHVRHPLFNDHEYSGDKIVRGTTFAKYRQFVYNCFDILQRPALHAKSLGFVHPSTQEELFFETDIPADMQAIIEKWRIYTANRPE